VFYPHKGRKSKSLRPGIDSAPSMRLFLCVMKQFSIMETQHNLARVLREVEAGQEVQITRRKKVVARLLPPLKSEEIRFPDFGARARRSWGDRWKGASSDELLDKSRGDR
jgi:antitoxin (DNA-binding transcriptional repressor) of toxin-antitoxin stability system